MRTGTIREIPGILYDEDVTAEYVRYLTTLASAQTRENGQSILLADGMQNSLAAALEISAWLRSRGMKSEILHGELSEIINASSCCTATSRRNKAPLRFAHRRGGHSPPRG